MSGFRLHWQAGPGAELEILNPAVKGGGYQLKYVPPFRATIRPPLQESDFGPGEVDGIESSLARLVEALDGRAGTPAAPAVAAEQSIEERMRVLGSMLFTLTVPHYVKTDLATEGIFLDIGMDESLLGYPWELMYDGTDFIAMRHSTGRFVNAASPAFQALPGVAWEKGEFDRLSVLLISVPRPPSRRGSSVIFEPLCNVEEETAAITQTLTRIDNVDLEVLEGPKATYDEVFQALQGKAHHIVHYCGHAQFDNQSPRLSSLVLYDKNMATGAVTGYFRQSKPLLCFVNACESAKTAESSATDARDRLNIYGLAQAFLETGSYLLGCRWKVADRGAAKFAERFYQGLLGEGLPVGRAIRDARRECRQSVPEGRAWASYLYYGDPRLSFGRS